VNPVYERAVKLLTRMPPSVRSLANSHRTAILRHIGEAHRKVHSRSMTILRMGLGRDSIAMLCLLTEQGLIVGGHRITAMDVDAVVFTDPGAEWSNTYALIPRVAEFCERNGLRFIVIAKPAAEGPKGWKQWVASRVIGSRGKAPWRDEGPEGESVDLKAARGYYQARAPIMSDYASRGTVVLYKDVSCTVNHKIGPNRALMSDLSLEKFGLDNTQWSGAVKKKLRPPHRLLLGIAADEAERAGDCKGPLYEKTYYPLVEMNVPKSAEAAILQRHGFDDTKKSGCFMCKFQPIEWYWALQQAEPGKFEEVVAYEANALKTSQSQLLKPKGVEPSNGWEGDPRRGRDRPKLPIREAVALWYELNKHRHPTVEDVLAKVYKRCDRADGTMVKKNPKVSPAVKAAFAADVSKLMDDMAGDGHESAGVDL
jgi:hypothetical protein